MDTTSTGCFRYLSCDIPPGVTIDDYRRSRTRSRRWWDLFGWRRG
jgi:hypothetical protein